MTSRKFGRNKTGIKAHPGYRFSGIGPRPHFQLATDSGFWLFTFNNTIEAPYCRKGLLRTFPPRQKIFAQVSARKSSRPFMHSPADLVAWFATHLQAVFGFFDGDWFGVFLPDESAGFFARLSQP